MPYRGLEERTGTDVEDNSRRGTLEGLLTKQVGIYERIYKQHKPGSLARMDQLVQLMLR